MGNIPERYRELMFQTIEMLRKSEIMRSNPTDWKDVDDYIFSELEYTKEELSEIYEGKDVMVYIHSAVE